MVGVSGAGLDSSTYVQHSRELRVKPSNQTTGVIVPKQDKSYMLYYPVKVCLPIYSRKFGGLGSRLRSRGPRIYGLGRQSPHRITADARLFHTF